MPELEIIQGQHYKKGEVVEIDNKHFIECKFTECILRMSGGNFGFTGCDFENVSGIELFGCAHNAVEFIRFIRERLNPNFFAPARPN